MNLLKLMTPAPGHEMHACKIYGVVVGVVTNNKDPDKLGRIKVQFPWLSEENESHWARLATLMAGANRGTVFFPEVGDEVLVAFEHGDIRFPYIIGALWNGVDAPPHDNADGKNNLRLIKSRSGHVIQLDDTSGSEKIEIIDRSGSNRIVINTADNTITIAADADITIQSQSGALQLSGNGIELKSQAGVTIEASLNVDVQASAQLNLKGALVNIN
jgi:uncharacterized protein involved in type VI secretion and phage assembly